MNIIEDLTPVNFQNTRFGVKIDTIVFHSMDGFYNGTISWFKNPVSKASCHYLISKFGEIRRMVKEEHRAFHAAEWNNRSIGIELEDELKKANWKYTQEQITSLRWLVQDIERRRGKLQYKLHKDISSIRSDPVGNFTLDWLLTVQPQPPMNPLPPELQKYSLTWKEIAVNKGFDINSAQFASYRKADEIISKVRTDKDNAIRAVGLDPADLHGSLNRKLAEAQSQVTNNEDAKLGRAYKETLKLAGAL